MQPRHTRDAQNGGVVAGTKGGYAMVLYPDGRQP